MPSFTFRLATLLRLREAARDERRAELAQAQAADDRLRAQLEALQQELIAMQAQQRTQSTAGALDLDWLLDAQRYQMVIAVQQQAIAADRQAVAVEIEKRRQTLIEADRQVRVLEKLREVQHERHRAAEEKQLMKQIDEVAGRMFGQQEQGTSPWVESSVG